MGYTICLNECMKKVTSDLRITNEELQQMAQRMFGNLVKAVIDVERRIMVVDGELHADEEAELLKEGSHQSNLWGINLYPELYGTDDWVEFDSMINLRPSQNNRSRSVENPKVQAQIREIIQELVQT